jgi:MFS family permease
MAAMSAARAILPLQMVFALNAVGLAVWFPRIPDVKTDLGLDVLTLAFCLFAMPAGTMLGFLGVARIIRRFGTRTTCVWGGSGFLVVFILPGLARDAVTLGLALFFCGLTIATIEVAMNAKASQTERVLGRRIMTRCHAFWSLGTVAGGLIGGLFAQGEVSFLTQQLLLQPVFAAATVFFALRLIADDPEPEAAPERGFFVPPLALVLLCLVPIGALLIEGAMLEWSALLMREDKGASPFFTGVTFAAFALGMAAARLSGDGLAERFGPRPVIVASGLVMGAGVGVFGLAPALWVSLPAAALVGAGCGNIYPLTMSMVGRIPSPRPERNVATLALVAFTAFLIGPPAIGTMAHAIGLPWALAALAPLGLVPLTMLRRPAPEPQPQ